MQDMLNEEKTSCSDEILLAVSKFPEPEQNICNWAAYFKSCYQRYYTGERLFSSARRLKTWLRTRMDRERFSNLAMNRQCLYRVAQEFGSRNENRNFKK